MAKRAIGYRVESDVGFNLTYARACVCVCACRDQEDPVKKTFVAPRNVQRAASACSVYAAFAALPSARPAAVVAVLFGGMDGCDDDGVGDLALFFHRPDHQGV